MFSIPEDLHKDLMIASHSTRYNLCDVTTRVIKSSDKNREHSDARSVVAMKSFVSGAS